MTQSHLPGFTARVLPDLLDQQVATGATNASKVTAAITAIEDQVTALEAILVGGGTQQDRQDIIDALDAAIADLEA